MFHLNETETDCIATLVPRQQILLKQVTCRHRNRRAAASSWEEECAGRSSGTYWFDIASCCILAIYVVRDPDKLCGFLQHTH